MSENSNHRTAVELLQELGLKEYEARCFVALSRRPKGTAKEISEISAVPRTRVYDAIDVLERKGLVEVQHSNPKQFRAVPVDEAVEALHAEFAERTEALRVAVEDIDPVERGDDGVTHEVWSLSGATAIDGRVRRLVDEADREVIVVGRREEVFSEPLLDRLRAASGRGVDVVVGTWEESVRDRIEADLPEASVFVSGVEALDRSPFHGDGTDIGRLLLVDRSATLVSSFTGNGNETREQAVFGRGFDNGFVAVIRRLVASTFVDGIAADAAG